MNRKEELAQMMLDKKLSFLPVEESYEFYNREGLEVDTGLYYVYNTEEIETQFDGTNLDDIETEMVDIYGTGDQFEIGGPQHFEEFTQQICPVYTYIDLIR